MSKISDFFSIVKPPVVSDEYPLVGGVSGYGSIRNVSDPNKIDVKAGSCFDSNGVEPIVVAAVVGLNVPTAINTVYNLFATKTGGVGSFQFDTDVNGSGLSVDYKRWIGFVLTNSSGDVHWFTINDGEVLFQSSFPVVGSLTTGYTQFDFSSVCPVSRVASIGFTANAQASVYSSMDGVNPAAYIFPIANGSGVSNYGSDFPKATTNSYFKSTETASLMLASVRLMV